MVYSFSIPYAKELYSGQKDFNEVFPNIQRPLECISGRDIVFRVLQESTTVINKGDALVEILFTRSYCPEKWKYYGDVVGRFIIYSEHSGYVYHGYDENAHSIDELVNPILIYSSLEELIENESPINYYLEEDEFSSEKHIKWHWFWSNADDGLGNKYMLSEKAFLTFTTENNLPVLLLEYFKSSINLNKKDSISFKFEDGTIKHFPVLKSPIRSGNSKSLFAVSLPLTTSDIDLFSNNDWEKMRIEYTNGTSPITLSNHLFLHYPDEFAHMLFKVYAQRFKCALQDLGIIINNNEQTKSSNYGVTLDADDACYVYLMKDTANGYYKIGISNHPDYRERTLQSEKPSIEKICAKKYPSRLIAQSIESALHTAFASKRIRGEWFDLSDLDVAQLIETLK